MYEQAGGGGRALFHPFEHSKEPSRALSWQPAPELPPMPVAYAAHYEAALRSRHLFFASREGRRYHLPLARNRAI